MMSAIDRQIAKLNTLTNEPTEPKKSVLGSIGSLCPHCGHPIAIRNPTGWCDHLHYPENCETCKRIRDKEVNMDEKQLGRELDMADMEKSSVFLKLEEGGAPVTLILDKLTEVPDKEYHLSSVDYQVQLHTTDGQILAITAWKLLNGVKAAVKKAGQIKGTKLRISRPDRGEYSVELVGAHDPE